ncbi:hypothetical protein [Streptomyces sp. NPDC055036]
MPPAPRLPAQTRGARGKARAPGHRTPASERTRHRYADIHQLLDEGWAVNAIARRLRLDRRTVDRYKKSTLDDLLASACDRRPNGVLEPFKAYLNERFAQLGSQGAGHRLFREIRERGYRGSVRNVQRYLARLDDGTAEPVRVIVPSPGTITSWITRPREA